MASKCQYHPELVVPAQPAGEEEVDNDEQIDYRLVHNLRQTPAFKDEVNKHASISGGTPPKPDSSATL